jgi:putative chitinase
MQLYEKYNTLFNNYGIRSALRTAHIMTQFDAECGLKPRRESLYFKTIEGLRSTFKTPFKGKSDAFVSQYLKDSVKCANYVYANRGGNGDEASGDGFKYRGGGFPQTTFKDGYQRLKDVTGIDFVANPDFILTEENALLAGLIYWKDNNLNKYADLDDLDAVSDQINIGRQTVKEGDANNYKHRKECLIKWKQILGI